jgi:hypothetical protein
MRYFGAIIFGLLTLLAVAGWWYLCLLSRPDNPGGALFTIIVMPALFLILVGPFAALFLVWLVRAFRE